MISASEGDSCPEPAGKTADTCDVVAAISMPRSSAAVLTLVSTPLPPESCALAGVVDSPEVPWDEGDRGVLLGLGSSVMKRKSSRQVYSVQIAFGGRRG